MDGQRKNTNTPGTILGPPPEKTVCPSMDTHMRDIPEAAASTSGNPLMTPERLKQRALNPKVAVEMDLSELENFKKFFDSWKFPPEYDCFQKAISELLFGFERVLLEQRASHAQPQKEKPQAVSMYETDEEELDHETNWVEKTKKRKKRNNNGFPGLQTDRNKVKPPPIFVEKKGPISSLTNLINTQVQTENFTTKSMDQNKIKINLEDEDSFRKTIHVLQQEDMVFHTYENKQSRPIRVMAKGLDHSSDPEDIVGYLTTKGYKILRADVKLAAKSKKPLNMFVLSFDKSENIDSIYKIREIMRQIVQICPMKGSKLVPQCKRCQEYGHTKNHCNKKPRCVKCAQGHLTVQCVKTKEMRPKCANCGEDHPANYRGCVVAKELQKRKNQQVKSNKSIKQHNRNTVSQQAPVQPVPKSQVREMSYARVTSQNDCQNKVTASESILQVILNEVKSIKQSMDDRFKEVTRRVNRIENRYNNPAPTSRRS
ncbi:hypothetical protein M8J77_005311 [Diaphorina citri]|nr:hypothetical protein M8J77_025906 [Diaphorina citri]KAI5734585.1 hypothetical protein M8J77_008412 [Diaphorina citri]KAI5746598.1 hypothetical protein M8J77_005311 [Diaphorina citri]